MTDGSTAGDGEGSEGDVLDGNFFDKRYDCFNTGHDIANYIGPSHTGVLLERCLV